MSPFNTIPTCDGRTDGRTNEQTDMLYQYRALHSYAIDTLMHDKMIEMGIKPNLNRTRTLQRGHDYKLFQTYWRLNVR